MGNSFYARWPGVEGNGACKHVTPEDMRLYDEFGQACGQEFESEKRLGYGPKQHDLIAGIQVRLLLKHTRGQKKKDSDR